MRSRIVGHFWGLVIPYHDICVRYFQILHLSRSQDLEVVFEDNKHSPLPRLHHSGHHCRTPISMLCSHRARRQGEQYTPAFQREIIGLFFSRSSRFHSEWNTLFPPRTRCQSQKNTGTQLCQPTEIGLQREVPCHRGASSNLRVSWRCRERR
jgi:hypothetical protein